MPGSMDGLQPLFAKPFEAGDMIAEMRDMIDPAGPRR
jgi:hypothetical protein